MTLSKEMQEAAAADAQATENQSSYSPIQVRDIIELAIQGRSALAKALMDDWDSKLKSYNRTKAHLEALEEEERRMPFWMWCVLWMNIGILLTLAFERAGTSALLWLTEWIKANGGMF